ncbi:MAG: hypothetical protein J6P07_04000 [Spirochaetaceae bacterium]|nr:hypothetical protein [Spirochaetaceae bacterium]
MLFDFDAPLVLKKSNRQTDDKTIFLELQSRFVAGDIGAMNSAWILCDKVADRLISKEYTKYGVAEILQNRDDIKHEMLCQLFRRYKRNPTYRVHGSICAVLYDCMRNVIYHPRKLEKLLSLTDDVELLQTKRTRRSGEDN